MMSPISDSQSSLSGAACVLSVYPRLTTIYEPNDLEKDSHNSPAISPVMAELKEGLSSHSAPSMPSPPGSCRLPTSTDLDRDDPDNVSPSKRAAAFAFPASSRLPGFEVDFEPGDVENPRSWPPWYKGLAIASLSFATWNVVFASTSYTSGMPGMMEDFGLASETVAALGVTAYLVGLAVGSLLTAPISEVCGRRPVYIGALFVSMLLVLPCALAKSFPEIIVARFFG
jgi:hypothetical protein